MTEQVLRFANFLAPALHSTYDQIVRFIARSTGMVVTLETGTSVEDLVTGRLAGAFLCGLVYVHLSRHVQRSVELSAAPLLYGKRYQRQPRYFSDIVVQRHSRFTSLAELAGCTWVYNEPGSHSGYNLVHYGLLQQKLSPAYFGRWLASGSHARSLDLVAHGEADATAIDSHVLSVLLRDDPALAMHIRRIGVFGPSAIPPVVVSSSLSARVKQSIQTALLQMADDHIAAQHLRHGFIERFVPVADEQYDDIRQMYDYVQADRRCLLSG